MQRRTHAGAAARLLPRRRPATGRPALQRWSFFVLFMLTAWLFWRIAAPLWIPICFGVLIAIGTRPLHQRLRAHLHGKWREGISAFLITALVVLAGFGFAVFLSAVILPQLLDMAVAFATRIREEPPELLLGPRLTAFFSSLGEDPARLREQLASASGGFASHLGAFVQGVLAASARALVQLIFTAITSYYLLRNGERFGLWLVAVLPLPEAEVRELERDFRDVARATLLGTGATALYQGAASSLAYWITGVPHALVWGTVTACASLIPAVGTTIIWAPAVLWLLAAQRPAMAIVLLAWSALVTVGIADYLLRPRLMNARVKMNELVMFIAIFGGIEAFGLLGTLLGPIIAALFTSMIQIYLRDYRAPAGLRQ